MQHNTDKQTATVRQKAPTCEHELGLYGVCKKCNAWPMALERAKRAVNGDSNDEEHDALIELIERAKQDEERIEQLSDHADKLAEVLRVMLEEHEFGYNPPDKATRHARSVLAAYESAVQS